MLESGIDPATVRFEVGSETLLKNTMGYWVRELAPPGGEFSNPIAH